MLALPPDTQCCPVPNNLEANKHVGIEEHLNHTAYCITHQVLSKPHLFLPVKGNVLYHGEGVCGMNEKKPPVWLNSASEHYCYRPAVGSKAESWP